MSNWFYYDHSGQKQGPITDGQLKELAMRGTISPQTVVETEAGKSAPAGKIKGLTFRGAAQPTPKRSAESNPFVAPISGVHQSASAPQSIPVPVAASGKGSIWITLIGVLLISAVGLVAWNILTPPKEQAKVDIVDAHMTDGGTHLPNNAAQDNNPPSELPPKPNNPVGPLVKGYNFSTDGVARVQTRDGRWHYIDKTGNIILTLGEGEVPMSALSKGVALVKRSDNMIELIDKNGKVLSSPKSGEYDQIVGFIPDIGMTLVHRHIDTYRLTEDQAGIIDSNGKWKIPLTNNPVFVYATKIDKMGMRDVTTIDRDNYKITTYDSTIITHLATLRYCGEGVFILLPPEYTHGDRNVHFYNILTGDTFKHEITMAFPHNIENGYGVCEFQGAVHSMDKSGKTTEIIKCLSEPNTTLGQYAAGLFYFKDGDNKNSSGFYDISGKRVIDLSKYKFIYSNYVPVFSDGYCVLNVLNPQGVKYYTVIDKFGKEMFEPRKNPKGDYGNADGITLSTTCGMIVFGDRVESGHRRTIMNVAGDTVAEFGEGYAIHDYKEDVALVEKGKHVTAGEYGVPGTNVIFEASNVFYIDKTGKRLIPAPVPAQVLDNATPRQQGGGDVPGIPSLRPSIPRRR